MTIIIVAAVTLLGMQTYPEFSHVTAIENANQVFNALFGLEIVLKILAEGRTPYMYFFDYKTWIWNWLDVMVLIFSYPVLPNNNTGANGFRLIRLLRLIKVMRKFPQLQMMISGIIGGFDSFFYICMLMVLVFYVFAVGGVILFSQCDPFHFSQLSDSMLFMMSITTLDNWGDSLYTCYYGCNNYNGNNYNVSSDAVVVSCNSTVATPIAASVFYVVMILISSFCIVSLFIGAVSTAMTDVMFEREQEKARKRAELGGRSMAEILLSKSNKQTRRMLRIADANAQNRAAALVRRISLLINPSVVTQVHPQACRNNHLNDINQHMKTRNLSHRQMLADIYLHLISYPCQDILDSYIFQNIMVMTILLVTIIAGMSTDVNVMKLYGDQLFLANVIVQSVFVFDCVLKILAEELRPWRFFYDPWNTFDVITIAASLVQLQSNLRILVLFRMLRLLQVLKLLQQVAVLQVLLSAIFSCLGSITFLCVMLFVFYYFFAVIGVTYFGANDPGHFGSIHLAMIALFDAATLDGWSSIMYITQYGCDLYPGNFPQLCTNPAAQYTGASIFWALFIMSGSLVLLSCFISIISKSMEETRLDQIINAMTKTDIMGMSSVAHPTEHSNGLLMHKVTSKNGSSAACMATSAGLFGDCMACGYHDQSVRFFNTELGIVAQTQPNQAHPIACIAMSNVGVDGEDPIVVTGAANGSLTFWDPESFEVIEHMKVKVENISCIDIHQGDDILVGLGTTDGQLHVWDLERNRLVVTCLGHKARINKILLKSMKPYHELHDTDERWEDHLLIVSASSDWSARKWNLETGKTTRIFPHDDSVTQLAIVTKAPIPLLVTAGTEKIVRVWDPQGGALIQVLTGHLAAVTALAVYEGNQILVITGSVDKAVRVFDLLTGECVCTLIGHTRPVQNIAMSRFGKHIAIVSQADIFHLYWNLGEIIKRFYLRDNIENGESGNSDLIGGFRNGAPPLNPVVDYVPPILHKTVLQEQLTRQSTPLRMLRRSITTSFDRASLKDDNDDDDNFRGNTTSNKGKASRSSKSARRESLVDRVKNLFVTSNIHRKIADQEVVRKQFIPSLAFGLLQKRSLVDKLNDRISKRRDFVNSYGDEFDFEDLMAQKLDGFVDKDRENCPSTAYLERFLEDIQLKQKQHAVTRRSSAAIDRLPSVQEVGDDREGVVTVDILEKCEESELPLDLVESEPQLQQRYVEVVADNRLLEQDEEKENSVAGVADESAFPQFVEISIDDIGTAIVTETEDHAENLTDDPFSELSEIVHDDVLNQTDDFVSISLGEESSSSRATSP